MDDLISRADAINAFWEDSDIRTAEVRATLKALPSAEATGDLISREDALRELNGACSNWEDDAKVAEIINALPSAEAVSREVYDKRTQADERIIDSYRREFSEVASSEAVQGEWILAEERPPEFPCLVCDANGNQPSVPMGIVTITDEEYGEWHIDGRLWDSPKVFVDGEWGNRIAYGNRIIAWQPLPKPYKGGAE